MQQRLHAPRMQQRLHAPRMQAMHAKHACRPRIQGTPPSHGTRASECTHADRTRAPVRFGRVLEDVHLLVAAVRPLRLEGAARLMQHVVQTAPVVVRPSALNLGTNRRHAL
eukprot:1770537-Pleurochrysis_carterae.AAC.6